MTTHQLPPMSLKRAWDLFTRHLEASGCSPRTLDHYTYVLSSFFAFLAQYTVADPIDITPTHIRHYFLHLRQRGVRDVTIHAHARAIKAWLRFLEREEVITATPMTKVAMPAVKKRLKPAFTEGEVKKLLKACRSRRDKAIILCLLDSGLRLAEFTALRVEDVEAGGMIKVQGKGGKHRYVRLGKKARLATNRYLLEQRILSGAVWCGLRGPLTASGIAQILRRVGKQAGVKNVHPHRFRRTFATWALTPGRESWYNENGTTEDVKRSV